jgi:peptidoglycan/LPS O-acetylase OafA/YrhL
MFAVISIIFSLLTTGFSTPNETNTITYFFDFASGGLAALALFRRTRITKWLSGLSQRQTILFYSYIPIHFIVLFFLSKGHDGTGYNMIDLTGRWIFIIYFSIFIIEQMINERRTRFFERNRFLIFTGKISYGLYCLHGITLTLGEVLFNEVNFLPSWIRILCLFTANYAAAVVSYYYFELPFLRLKQRFRQ